MDVKITRDFSQHVKAYGNKIQKKHAIGSETGLPEF